MGLEKLFPKKLSQFLGSTLALLATTSCNSVEVPTRNYQNTNQPDRNNDPSNISNHPSTNEEEEITLYPIADAYVNSSLPNQNFGDEFNLRTGGIDLGDEFGDYIAYIKFDLTEVPRDKTIKKAELKLFSNWDDAKVVQPRGVTRVSSIERGSWGEHSVTYRTRPSESRFLDSANVQFNVGKPYWFDVTSAVRIWHNYDQPNRGFEIDTTDFTNTFWDSGTDFGIFYASPGGYGPELIVTIN